MNKILKVMALFSFVLIVSSCKLLEIAIEEIEDYYEEEQSNSTNTNNNVTNTTNTATNQTQITDAEKYKDGPNTIAQGKSGFLWKPISDSTGYPALLLPPRFTGKSRAVTLNGVNLTLDKVANGYREHYRMRQHYTGLITVKVVATDGIGGAAYLWTWIVPDASQRHDSNVTPTFVKL